MKNVRKREYRKQVVKVAYFGEYVVDATALLGFGNFGVFWKVQSNPKRWKGFFGVVVGQKSTWL